MAQALKVGLVTVSLDGERLDLAERFAALARESLVKSGLEVAERARINTGGDQVSESVKHAVDRGVDCIIFLIGTWIYAPAVVTVVQKTDIPFIVWGIPEGASFSSVGANVLHGSLDELGIHHKLVYGLPDDPQTIARIRRYASAASARQALQGRKFGLIGGRSIGMYTSTVDPIQVKKIFGVEIEHIDQSLLIEYAKKVDSKLTQKTYEWLMGEYRAFRAPEEVVKKSIQVYHALKRIVQECRLDFLGVKCLEEVINLYVSCCLAICLLNNEGIVTACQSDINAALLMKTLHVLTKQPTIFADVNCIDKESKVARLINCGTMPTCLAKNNKEVDWGYQYEYMGKARGVCPVFCCKPGAVTITAMSRISGKHTMQIASGDAFEQPIDRFAEVRDIWPQAFIRLDCDVDEYYTHLRSNHAVVGYGDVSEELIDFCDMVDIAYIRDTSRRHY